MLQGINKLGKSWVGRVLVAFLFGFLIISFAIWGIGDIFRGAVRTQVANVGGVDISGEAFRNAYQTEYQALIRRARRSITPEQARALGLEQRVLARLVSEAAFDQEARRLGLAASDEAVIKAIQADPSFNGRNGAFDRGIFAELLRSNGLSEAQYVRDRRSILVRQQIAESLVGAVKAPLAMREALHRFTAERRSAEFIRLGPEVLGEQPDPTEAQLAAFYEERKGSFRSPEYRTINYLLLDAAALAKPESVSEADARAHYERIRDNRFGAPERRTVQQIVFPNRSEAEAASARLASGTSFEALASERGIDQPNLNLGTFTKGEMLDKAVAEAAFELPEGGVSRPVDGRFGPVLLRVTKVETGSARPFEEVAAEVKHEVARERAAGELQPVHDAVEDLRASGKGLAEVAREKGLKLVASSPVDRGGRDKSGNDALPIPERDAVLASVFRSEAGADNEAVTLGNGGYLWFEVTGIEPAQDRPLAQVRDRVAAEWKQGEISRGLADKARELADRIDKGESSSAIAASLGLKVEQATDLARGQAKDGLDAGVIARIFATTVGKAASAPSGQDARVLFKVTAATLPPFVTTTQESASQEQQLRALVEDDLLAEYLADLEKRIGVKLYPNNVRRAIGGES